MKIQLYLLASLAMFAAIVVAEEEAVDTDEISENDFDAMFAQANNFDFEDADKAGLSEDEQKEEDDAVAKAFLENTKQYAEEVSADAQAEEAAAAETTEDDSDEDSDDDEDEQALDAALEQDSDEDEGDEETSEDDDAELSNSREEFNDDEIEDALRELNLGEGEQSNEDDDEQDDDEEDEEKR
ncbi:nucleolin-like [Sycon ciliatum]|uniref:nucleolin-like n=1 Tax=Sycon ciliatum TaxID=27933 RepID=UPI0020AB70E6|eukprot:scpid91121/ scgid9257/ 